MPGLLWVALIFLLVAVVAYFFRAGEAGALALTIAKVCLVLFVVLLVVSLILGAASPGPYWGWPYRAPVVP